MKLTIVLQAALLALVFSGGVAAKTLKIATLAPAGTNWMKQMKAGAARIKERTDGRVKLKFYPGGVMGSYPSIHRKIKIGQLHGGAFSSGGLARVDSSIVSLGLPMLFDTLAEVDHIRELIEPELKRRMAESGFIIIGLSEGGFAHMMSKKAVNDAESLRATKVWLPEGDEISQYMYETLGITPLSLPISDVFTGLQTGLIETVTVNPSSAIAFQWHTSAGYMTDWPIAYLIGVLAIEKKSFNRLKPDDQAIVHEEISAVFERLDRENREDNRKALEALQNQGIDLLPPTDAEVVELKRLAAQAIDRMIADGIVQADLVAQIRAALAEYRARQ